MSWEIYLRRDDASGLYYRDTRYLSILDLTINGHKPRHLASSCRQNASVHHLRIGKKTLNLHFDRRPHDEETRFEISDNEARVEVIIPAR